MGTLRTKLRCTASLVAAAIAMVAPAQDVKVDKYKLPNGMTVILHEDRSLPVATVNIWYKVGSKDEPERRSGFAHLFEHLMFMGTRRVPQGQFDKIMEGGGGSNNASTAEDRTNYFESGPANLLPTLLYLEADRIEELGKNIDQKKLDLQRDVVKNERRQNVENTPYGRGYESVNGLMFPRNHPYHNSVIGSMEDLSAAAVEDVQNFFATYYVPNNASLVVAGDFDPKTIRPMIDSLFGTLPRGNDIVRKPVPPVEKKGVQRLTMVDQVEAPKSLMVWHSPAAYKPGDPEMSLAAAVLTDGINSRLYNRLVVKEQLATEVSAFQESRLLGSLFYVDATAAEGVSQDRLEKAIDEELARLAKEGPTAEELKRQAAKVEYGIVSGLQSVQNKADRLNEFEFYFGEPNSFKRVLDMYRKVSPRDVQNAVRKTLDPDNRLIIRVVAEAEKPEQNPRDVAPPIGEPSTFQPQLPREFTLSNGVKVFYWQRPELPLMSIATQFRAGADNDPAEKAGRADLTADMLDEGAGNLDAAAFSNALENLGANFGASAGHNSSSTSLSVLSSNFDKALGLYADAILRPRFDPKEWERVQRLTVADLEQERASAAMVARKVGLREFFGANHPYGRPTSGTVQTVKDLKVDDLKAAHAAIYQPQNATFFVAGSLDEAAVKAGLERAFAGWRGTGTAVAATPTYAPPANEKLRVVLVDKPGAVQTVVRFYMPAPVYNDPNRIKLNALGTILGGTFTSRLNTNLREEKGYTYGAGSGYSFEPHVGYLTANAEVRTDVTGASIKEFLNEFRKIRAGDVTDAEVAKAVSSGRTDTINAMATLGGILGTAMSLHLNGQPFSALAEELRAMQAIKASDINGLANPGIPLERGVLVLVGDKSAILPQLKDLGLPNPVEVKAD